MAKLERQGRVLADRLVDPDLADLGPVKALLSELDGRQRELRAQVADLTLQLRQRREQVVSPDEVLAAFRQFDELWEELTFPERQYAIRLLVRAVGVSVRKGQKEGRITIEAWGRSPTPLKVRVGDFRERKLRNQNGWLPELDSNQQPSD